MSSARPPSRLQVVVRQDEFSDADAARAERSIACAMAARKSRRDAAGCLNPMTQRLRRFRTVLEPLGLWEGFNALPRGAQESFARNKFPDPVLDFDESYPDDADIRVLRKKLIKGFDEASIGIGAGRVNARDFFSV